MTFALSFSPEFFLAEGEPYDRKDIAVNDKGEPISVYSALCMMYDNEPEKWKALARDVYGLAPGKFLDPETVLTTVQETNTCTNLSSPVEVWIDKNGDYRIKVYDGNEKYRP